MIARLLTVLTYWIALQDFVCSILYNMGIPTPVLQVILVSKELLVIVVFTYLFFSKVRFPEARKKFPLYGFVFIGIVCVFFFVGDAPFQAKIASARMFSLPLLLSFLGFWGIDSPEELNDYLEHVFRCSILVAVFGLIEYFLLPLSFWVDTVPLFTFMQKVKFGVDDPADGTEIFGNLYGDYGFGYMAVRRLISFFGSPLSTAYFLFFSVVVSFVLVSISDKRKVGGGSRRTLGGIVCLLALFLTFTRAVLIPLIVIMAYHFGRKRKRVAVALGALVLILILIFVDLKAVYESLFEDASAVQHAAQLVSAYEEFIQRPWGNGLGTAGAWAIRFFPDALGTESSTLTLLIQVGVEGLVVFAVFWYRLMANGLKAAKNFGGTDGPAFRQILIYTSIGYLITAVISEQIFTFTSISFYWIFLGSISGLGAKTVSYNKEGEVRHSD